LSSTTCKSCKDQKVALKLQRTYDFLTWLRDEFDPLRAQLLTRHSCVSLMDALVVLRNQEIRLWDAGLLRISFVLLTRSSVACPTALMPLASSPIALPVAHGESIGLHCDQCGRDGHVDAFCYRKKKAYNAQTRRSS
jgi:hypothetical protein